METVAATESIEKEGKQSDGREGRTRTAPAVFAIREGNPTLFWPSFAFTINIYTLEVYTHFPEV
jgi:hypothetical protein